MRYQKKPQIKKVCVFCKSYFFTKLDKKVFCSPECYSKSTRPPKLNSWTKLIKEHCNEKGIKPIDFIKSVLNKS